MLSIVEWVSHYDVDVSWALERFGFQLVYSSKQRIPPLAPVIFFCLPGFPAHLESVSEPPVATAHKSLYQRKVSVEMILKDVFQDTCGDCRTDLPA